MSALSYARGPELPYLECTTHELLERTAAHFPDRPALVVRHQGMRLTWRQLAEEVRKVADGLLGLGLKPGDRVGVWATNCAEWVYLQLGIARAGMIQINVNPAYRSHELSYILRQSGMKALVLRDSDARTSYRKTLEEALAKGPCALEHIVYLPDGTQPDASWENLIRRGIPQTRFPTDPHAVVNIQYTSGTTGNPKGVLLTHHNLLNNARVVELGLHASEQDRLCVPVPLYHCFGCVAGSLMCLVTGATMLLPAPTFDPKATLEAVSAEEATLLYGVPTMFIALLNHPDFTRFPIRALRSGVMAGAPCPIEIMKRVVTDMHCEGMTIGYGQTEASPIITLTPDTETFDRRVATVGCTAHGTEVKIVGADGATVPVGQQGELCTRGYLIMKGYDKDPDATARAVDPEGWLHTGDLATMRPDGYIRITGRLKDLIIRGGENIYPREIEDYLYTHPKVSDVQVVGVPDEKYGEVVAVWIRLKAGAQSSPEEIEDFCRTGLAHYKIPQYIRFVDAFPMTVTGKIQKFRIREIEITERHLETAAAIETA